MYVEKIIKMVKNDTYLQNNLEAYFENEDIFTIKIKKVDDDIVYLVN